MVLKPEPIFEAVDAIKLSVNPDDTCPMPIILLSPAGRLFNQKVACELAGYNHLILICGHYEGIDERVREHLATDEVSIGDYVLTGGELPAMAVIDAVVRLLPGVLAETSVLEESHTEGLLEYPQYTRPPVYQGWAVPEVLLSGNHAQIARWRREQAIKKTAEHRRELLAKVDLTPEEKEQVAKLLASKAK
jgi:tRNA (guanine37-N1)-methyltransferase